MNVVGKVVDGYILYTFDAEGNQTKKEICIGGETRAYYYEHSEDKEVVTSFWAGNKYVTSHSKNDKFGRKVFDELQLGGGFVSRQFAYHAGEVTEEHKAGNKLKSSPTTNLVSQIVLSDGRTISYEYDAEERIAKVVDSVDGTTEYTYDALGQLLTETKDGIVINAMTYDNYGNILSKNGIAYIYDDPIWKDKLTGYGEQTITYDDQGNLINYLGHTLTWEKGRQLKSFDDITYTYNANGIRTSKTVNGVTHTYFLENSKIHKEVWGTNTLIPLYNNEDEVCGILYNATPYYFLKNQQGDIISITDQTGEAVAKYSYDAWGVCTIAEDTTDIGIATINPFRYRGYYFDNEAELYYITSRYYDPTVGRFLNTDKVMGANDDHTTYALYTYCGNNPISRYDVGGLSWKSVWKKIKNSVRTALNKTNKYLISLGIDTALLGSFFLMMYKDKKGIYHAKFNCWQQFFGYNDFYDFMFDIGTSMKNVKFPFKSEGKSLIFWAWKGNYINLGAGAELGIYYGGGPHWKVDKKLAMYMTMELYYRGSKIISHSAKTWWITGFNPNPKYLDVKASELKANFTVYFIKLKTYTDFKSKYSNKWKFNRRELKASYTF